MNDEQALARSHAAKSDYRAFEAAFDTVREAILAELVQTSPTLPDKVLKLHMAAQNLAAVRKALLTVVQGGEIAAHALALAGLNRP